MAYASAVMASQEMRMPSVAMPKVRWPRLSQRTRAVLMMGIMVSPCFLSDGIGYYVQRVFSPPMRSLRGERLLRSLQTSTPSTSLAPIRSCQRRSRRAGFLMLLYMVGHCIPKLVRDASNRISICAVLVGNGIQCRVPGDSSLGGRSATMGRLRCEA
jgi:hypothetical protein